MNSFMLVGFRRKRSVRCWECSISRSRHFSKLSKA